MKTPIISRLSMAALAVTLSFSVQAQTKAGKAIDKTEKAAKRAGDKTAEKAAKGVAEVKDSTYKGKMAPDGSNVYIDNKNQKYYINSKGKKIYLKASQIKDRPKD